MVKGIIGKKVGMTQLFDDENMMTRIDMSEYQEKFSATRLIGAPIKTGEPHGSSPGNILANQIRTLVPPVSQRSNFSAEGTYSIAVSNSFARF